MAQALSSTNTSIAPMPEQFEVLKISSGDAYNGIKTNQMDSEFLNNDGDCIFDGRVISLFTSGAHNCCYIHAFSGAISPLYRSLDDGNSNKYSLGNNDTKLRKGGFALKIKRDLIAKLITPYFEFKWTDEDTSRADEDAKTKLNSLVNQNVYFDTINNGWSWEEKKMLYEVKAYKHIYNSVDVINEERVYEETQKGELRNFQTYQKVIENLSLESEYQNLVSKFTEKMRGKSDRAAEDVASGIFDFLSPEDIKNASYLDYKTYKEAMDVANTQIKYNERVTIFMERRRKVREIPSKSLYEYYVLNRYGNPRSRFGVLPNNYTPAIEETKEDKLTVSTEVYRYLRGAADLLVAPPNLPNLISGNSYFRGMNTNNDAEMGALFLSAFEGSSTVLKETDDSKYQSLGNPSWYSLLRQKLVTSDDKEIAEIKELKENHLKQVAEFNIKARAYNKYIDATGKIPVEAYVELIPTTQEEIKYNATVHDKNVSGHLTIPIQRANAPGNFRSMVINLSGAVAFSRPIPPSDVSLEQKRRVDIRVKMAFEEAFRYARFTKEYYKRKKNPPAPFNNISYLRAHGIQEYDPFYDCRWLQSERSWGRNCDLNIGFYCMGNGQYPYKIADFAEQGAIQRGMTNPTDKMLMLDDLFNHLALTNMNGLILANLLSEYLNVNFVISGDGGTNNPIAFVYAKTYLPNKNYVVIRLADNHYETIAFLEYDGTGKPCLRTVFDRNHPFIRMLIDNPVSRSRHTPSKTA
jgi:hypothetical protein